MNMQTEYNHCPHCQQPLRRLRRHALPSGEITHICRQCATPLEREAVPSRLDVVAIYSAMALPMLPIFHPPFELELELVLLTLVVLLALASWLNPWRDYVFFLACTAGERRRGRLRPGAGPFRVEVTKEAVCVERGKRGVEVIGWQDLQAFHVLTTDAGPLADDVFFYLRAEDGRELIFPQDVEGARDLLRAMHQQATGFDDELFINAMGCTSNRRFRVWERPAAGALPAAG